MSSGVKISLGDGRDLVQAAGYSTVPLPETREVTT
jgi:hypothetical protein